MMLFTLFAIRHDDAFLRHITHAMLIFSLPCCRRATPTPATLRYASAIFITRCCHGCQIFAMPPAAISPATMPIRAADSRRLPLITPRQRFTRLLTTPRLLSLRQQLRFFMRLSWFSPQRRADYAAFSVLMPCLDSCHAITLFRQMP